MAERVLDSNYQAMIQALYDFKGRVYTLANELHNVGLQASSALGDDDSAVAAIRRDLRNCTVKYCELTEKATEIAKGMEEEIESAKKDHSLWYGDE